MDRMTLQEAGMLAEGWMQERRDRWEMTRRVCHAVFQSQSSRPLDPEDVMEFPWDSEGDGNGNDGNEEDWTAARNAAAKAIEMRKNGKW